MKYIYIHTLRYVMFVIERTLMFVFIFILFLFYFYFYYFFSIKHHLLVVDRRESRRDKQDGPI